MGQVGLTLRVLLALAEVRGLVGGLLDLVTRGRLVVAFVVEGRHARVCVVWEGFVRVSVCLGKRS